MKAGAFCLAITGSEELQDVAEPCTSYSQLLVIWLPVPSQQGNSVSLNPKMSMLLISLHMKKELTLLEK